jgi:hypothetical protein
MKWLDKSLARLGGDRALGPEHLALLEARGSLAAAYQAAGQAEKALALLEQNTEQIRSIRGGAHNDTLRCARLPCWRATTSAPPTGTPGVEAGPDDGPDLVGQP